MGALEFIGILAIILVLNKIIKNKILIIIYVLFFSWVSGATWLGVVYKHLEWEPYFQYWPLRFLFPALGIYFFYSLTKNTNKKIIVFMSILGAMAALWNLDTGVPVIGAFWIYLLMRIFFPQNDTRQKRLLYLLLSFVTTILCWSLFILYLHLKSGETIHLSNIVKYQKIFAIYGIGMLPVPVNYHPWMIFYSAYILGLIVALFSWIKKQTSPVNDLLFFMSILGFGLFTYYQGRAHEYNLIIIAWLPLMVMLILTDRLIRLVKAQRLPRSAYLISTPIIILTALIGFNFILEIPDLVSYSKETISIMRNQPQTPVLTNIQFIKQSLHQSKYAVILSTNQGAYYAETRVISPINTPSLVETLIKSDYQSLIDQLTLHPIEHLFIQTEPNNQIPTEFKVLLPYYRIQNESKAGMLYLIGKKI